MTLEEVLRVADAFPEPVLIVEGSGRILGTNRTARTELGLGGCSGKPLEAIVVDPADEIEAYLRACRRSVEEVPGVLALRDGGAEPQKLRSAGRVLRPRSDTDEAWVLLRLFRRSPLVARFQALGGQLHSLEREVARRRSLEVSLRESQTRAGAVMETSLDAILLMDETGVILEVNPAAEATFGRAREAMVGKPMVDLLVPPHLREAHREGLRRYLATGETRILGRRIETTALRADGTAFPVELATTVARSAAGTVFTGTIRDISAWRAQREALEEQLRLVAFGRDVGLAVSQAPSAEAMLERCAALLVAHHDAAFARIWSLDATEDVLVLRASAGLYTHLDGAHARTPVGSYKIGRIAERQEPHLTNDVRSDPEIHDPAWAAREGMVAFAGYPLLVDGRTVGVLAMFARHPLSERTLEALGAVANAIALGMERKRVEGELRQRSEALQLAARRKDEFLAMLAHELRNPLAPIRTGLEILALEQPENPTIADMKTQLATLVRLVDDLLDVSRITHGRIELRKRRIDARDVLDRALVATRSVAFERGHEFEVEIPDAPVWIEGDEVRLTQVFTNLLTNAIKYTPRQGSIRLGCGVEGEVLVVRVIDDGIGIEPALLEEVFDPFVQSGRSLDRSEGGLGIGLTLSRRLVEAHQGSITASSAGPGLGTEMVVRVPLASDADAPVMPAPPPEPRRERRRAHRVLVIEDNESAARALAKLISMLWDDEVEVAFDGLEGWQVAQRWNPDVVLVDIGLPGIDGFEVARRLREHPDTAGARLVALTGYGTTEDRERSREAGFDLHLVKPIEVEDLETVWRSLGDEGGAPPS